MRILLSLLIILIPFYMNGQNDSAPYREIPDAPQSYTSGAVVSRMIDGLGFRFYWATEGLRDEDLSYRPSPDSRTTSETIDHIVGLVFSVSNTASQDEQEFPDLSSLSLEQKRVLALNNLKAASDRMKVMNDDQISELKVIFAGGRVSPYPYWNMLNGPLADAIYHTGQVTMLRRASGNPVNPNVSVFTGKLRE